MLFRVVALAFVLAFVCVCWFVVVCGAVLRMRCCWFGLWCVVVVCCLLVFPFARCLCNAVFGLICVLLCCGVGYCCVGFGVGCYADVGGVRSLVLRVSGVAFIVLCCLVRDY